MHLNDGFRFSLQEDLTGELYGDWISTLSGPHSSCRLKMGEDISHSVLAIAINMALCSATLLEKFTVP